MLFSHSYVKFSYHWYMLCSNEGNEFVFFSRKTREAKKKYAQLYNISNVLEFAMKLRIFDNKV